jgi:hypothetical protein
MASYRRFGGETLIQDKKQMHCRSFTCVRPLQLLLTMTASDKLVSESWALALKQTSKQVQSMSTLLLRKFQCGILAAAFAARASLLHSSLCCCPSIA